MSYRTSSHKAATLRSPPPLGTLINDRFELVEVLGTGGFAVVYRAVDTTSPQRTAYAFKCLIHNAQDRLHQQLHAHEIEMHRRASESSHPGVCGFHGVIKSHGYTYIATELSSEGDLYAQISDHGRYLGRNALLRDVFLQLVDAVEHCHSVGVYHRDIKPENVLCFDGGRRLCLTDFGLSTTDLYSEDYHTGSLAHMSPECFTADFSATGDYSSCANDVWSLAIVFINTLTGYVHGPVPLLLYLLLTLSFRRSAWTSASKTDPSFVEYMANPSGFLPSVLPISDEINDILIHMLDVDWRWRMTLVDLREALQRVKKFYCEGVVFENGLAYCPWEKASKPPRPSTKRPRNKRRAAKEVRSCWSNDSCADTPVRLDGPGMHYAPENPAETPSADYPPCNMTCEPSAFELESDGAWLAVSPPCASSSDTSSDSDSSLNNSDASIETPDNFSHVQIRRGGAAKHGGLATDPLAQAFPKKALRPFKDTKLSSRLLATFRMTPITAQ
ncbi:hypothetical protein PLICRDRAFT_30976 [Plicaturopsis crispa FD-325 SS-3]|nr:hypothetical protein PLICRDRAFT_30976 [Plicaturopsis crispa FD-325 SS-3]